jgi:hypothetical protein
MATITQQPAPHWRDKQWEYIPAADHADSAKFKERMKKWRESIPVTTKTTVPIITEKR